MSLWPSVCRTGSETERLEKRETFAHRTACRTRPGSTEGAVSCCASKCGADRASACSAATARCDASARAFPRGRCTPDGLGAVMTCSPTQHAATLLVVTNGASARVAHARHPQTPFRTRTLPRSPHTLSLSLSLGTNVLAGAGRARRRTLRADGGDRRDIALARSLRGLARTGRFAQRPESRGATTALAMRSQIAPKVKEERTSIGRPRLAGSSYQFFKGTAAEGPSRRSQTRCSHMSYFVSSIS